MPRRATSLTSSAEVAISREIDSKYDNVRTVADAIDNVITVSNNISNVDIVGVNITNVNKKHD